MAAEEAMDDHVFSSPGGLSDLIPLQPAPASADDGDALASKSLMADTPAGSSRSRPGTAAKESRNTAEADEGPANSMNPLGDKSCGSDDADHPTHEASPADLPDEWGDEALLAAGGTDSPVVRQTEGSLEAVSAPEPATKRPPQQRRARAAPASGKPQPQPRQQAAAAGTVVTVAWASGWEDTGRGRRNRVRPLQFWRHERVEYVRTTGAPVPEVCAVVLRSPESPPARARSRADLARSPPSAGVPTPATTGRRGRAVLSPAAETEAESGSPDEGGPARRAGASKRRAGGGPNLKAAAAARPKAGAGAGPSAGTRRTPVKTPGAARGRKRAAAAAAGGSDPDPPDSEAAAAAAPPPADGVAKATRRRLYAAAVAAFRDDRFDD
jgi:hypothetical protein